MDIKKFKQFFEDGDGGGGDGGGVGMANATTAGMGPIVSAQPGTLLGGTPGWCRSAVRAR